MSLVELQNAFISDVAKLIVEAQARGYLVSGGELWRTPEQQQRYYEQGASLTRNGLHLQRLAIDLNFFSATGVRVEAFSELIHLGEFWQFLNPNNKWGGYIKGLVDCGHFERQP